MFYLTCSGKTDDGGARLISLLSVYVFWLEYGKIMKFDYIHTPFHFKYFGVKYKREESYIKTMKQWDEFLKFDFNECPVDNILKRDVKYMTDGGFKLFQKSKIRATSLSEYKNKIVAVPSLQFIFDKRNKGNLYDKWRDTLHEKFKQSRGLIYSPDFTSYFEKDIFNIVIHIRRGDIKPGVPKYVEDDYYIELIKRFHEDLKDKKKYKIYIFTQTKNFNRSIYKTLDCTIRTDSDDSQFIAFNHMVLADVLVIPRSAFSYSAALLNKNRRVLYKKIHHNALPSWSYCNDYVDKSLVFDIDTDSFTFSSKA